MQHPVLWNNGEGYAQITFNISEIKDMAEVYSDKQINKISRIDQAIKEYFEANPSTSEINARNLMPIFIQKGIFYKNERDGLPIKNLLRKLYKEDKLSLLKNAKVIRHPVTRKWHFCKE